jgi:hypothetical protein
MISATNSRTKALLAEHHSLTSLPLLRPPLPTLLFYLVPRMIYPLARLYQATGTVSILLRTVRILLCFCSTTLRVRLLYYRLYL